MTNQENHHFESDEVLVGQGEDAHEDQIDHLETFVVPPTEYDPNPEQYLWNPEVAHECQSEMYDTFVRQFFQSQNTSEGEIDRVVAEMVESYSRNFSQPIEEAELAELKEQADLAKEDQKLHPEGSAIFDFVRKISGEDEYGSANETNTGEKHDSIGLSWTEKLTDIIMGAIENRRARRILVNSMLTLALADTVGCANMPMDRYANQIMSQGMQTGGRIVGREVYNAITTPVQEQIQEENIQMRQGYELRQEQRGYAMKQQQIINNPRISGGGYSQPGLPGSVNERGSQGSLSVDPNWENQRIAFENSPNAHPEQIGLQYVDANIVNSRLPVWKQWQEEAIASGDVSRIAGVNATIAQEQTQLVQQYAAPGTWESCLKIVEGNRQRIYANSPEGRMDQAIQGAEYQHNNRVNSINLRTERSRDQAEQQNVRRQQQIEMQNARDIGRFASGGVNTLFRAFGQGMRGGNRR